MPPPADFTFVFETLPTTGLDDLRPFYERMPLDPYINGVFRRRRFAHFLGPAQALRRLPHMQFVQSKRVNPLVGDVRREFAEIEDGFIAMPALQTMVARFTEFMGIDSETREIGVHQIRILCAPEYDGSPAPEGIHQDGFDYIGIFCVDRHRIHGATTRIYPAKDQPPLFSRQLLPGEVVFANDRKVFHFAEQVQPSENAPGHWDLLVITA
jgi:hypothetical protein